MIELYSLKFLKIYFFLQGAPVKTIEEREKEAAERLKTLQVIE